MSRRVRIQEGNGVSFCYSPPRHFTNLELPFLYTHFLTSFAYILTSKTSLQQTSGIFRKKCILTGSHSNTATGRSPYLNGAPLYQSQNTPCATDIAAFLASSQCFVTYIHMQQQLRQGGVFCCILQYAATIKTGRRDVEQPEFKVHNSYKPLQETKKTGQRSCNEARLAA